MAELKTKVNKVNVKDFLGKITNTQRREDAFKVLQMMKKITRKQARMWGPSIVGFDQYHYRYDSGHEGDMCMVGFSPRSQALTLYVMPGFKGQAGLLQKLGKHKAGKGCLYIKKLADIDPAVLEKIIAAAYQHMKQTYA